MWVWVDRLGVLVLDVGISAAVLWAVAALAMLGSRQPARRRLIARAAAAGSLAFVPLIGFDLVPQYDLLALFAESGLAFDPVTTMGLRREPHSGGPDPLATTGGLAVLVWLSRVLTLLYAAAVAVGLSWLALGYAGLAWVAWGSQEPSAGSKALLEALPFPGRRRRPRLRLAARVRRPVLVGLARPVILIPPALDRPEARDHLRLSLLHELAHAEAGDREFGLLGNLARVFWFFLPPLWWVDSQVRLDQEFLADRRAAEGYGPVRAYASSLLELAGAAPGSPAADPAGRADAGAGVGLSPLIQRFLMLLRCPFPVEPAPPVWWSRGLPWLVVLVTLAVSTLTVRYPAERPANLARGHTFRMSHLDVPVPTPDPDGRCPAFELPIRLPARFVLCVEVWADLPTLARMRLAGLPLSVPGAETRPGPPGWHIVEIDHGPGVTTLRVDGTAVPLPANVSEPAPWLSVEPAPGHLTLMQGLSLSW